MRSLISYIKEILYLLGDNRKQLVWLNALFLLSSFLDVVGLGIIGPYLMLVMNPSKMAEGHLGAFINAIGVSLPARDALVVMGLGLVVIFLLKACAAIFINWKILMFSRKCRVDLQGQLMRAYQQQPYIQYLQRNSSEYIKNIYDATAHYVSSVEGLLRLLSEGIVSLFVLCFLAVTNGPVLGVLLTVLGGAMLFYDRFFRRKAKKYGQLATDGAQGMVQGIHEGIIGFKELRILGKANYFHKAVIDGATEVSENWSKGALIAMAPRYLLEFILVAFVILFVLISLVTGGDINTVLPTLGVFAVASLRLMPSANLVTGGLSKLSYGRHAVSLLYTDVKNIEKYAMSEFREHTLEHPRETFDTLELTNISFQYPGTSQCALKNLSLSIKAGESIGIIGPSGGGKTTLIDVLLGLLEPQQGSIRYNARELKDALSDWRSQVAYLPQEIFLVDNTLRCNIALGVPSAEIDDARIVDAIKQAQLSDMVKDLPKGVETVLGERGVRLSGGQRQRVALARAFYFERSVLVLDEATSALDNETEREIVDEIKRLKGKKTLVVIAHRLTTIEHCDRIYKLKQGEIVETGSYGVVVEKKS